MAIEKPIWSLSWINLDNSDYWLEQSPKTDKKVTALNKTETKINEQMKDLYNDVYDNRYATNFMDNLSPKENK